MWSIRRASITLRRHALDKQNLQAFGSITKNSSFFIEENAKSVSDRPSEEFLRALHSYPKSIIMSCRFLSLQAGKESSNDEEDDGGVDDVILENDLEAISPEEVDDDVELVDTENDVSEKKVWVLLNKIWNSYSATVGNVMDKWLQEGNDVSRPQISAVMSGLRKSRNFVRALQLSEWLETSKKIEFADSDYATRLYLIAKVHGLEKSEDYMNNNIPKSSKKGLIYATLLGNAVMACNVSKAEQIYNKMKDLKFTITPFCYNQLLLLYRKMDKKKISQVLLLMEKDNAKPDLFTYKLLIDIKGEARDIDGLDQVVETMIRDGIKPDVNTQAIIARHYISAGHKEKALAVLKQMEGDNLEENRWICRHILPLYANIGKSAEVYRIWNICKSNPRITECKAAIDSFGTLKKIPDAEEVFDQMSKAFKKLFAKHYTALLAVYANHKMLDKGKDLARKMIDSGCEAGPLTWDALVKLYVNSGQVEKADSFLYKASQENKLKKPMFKSYMMIMNQYAKKGDIHNTEKIFTRMRQVGYVGRHKEYESLLKAYINAKKPAYGIRERMKGDNVFPNKFLNTQLPLVDAFRKDAISAWLD